jgi:methylmalonyl-CoA/ethylmalonyl-CoA epimerase
MPGRLPFLRVDHVSIAVREMEPALAFFRRLLPIRMREAPRPGYDGQFTWADFFVGDRKIELIESARSGSFVDRFIAQRGEGFHHLSLDVEEQRLDAHVAFLERAGLRIVDRGDYGNGDQTAFISPRTTPGILVQFWQVPGFRGARPDDVPSDPVATRGGVRYRVDHLALAVRSIDATLAWFQRFFPVEVTRPKHVGRDGSHHLLHFWLADYKFELLEPTGADSFVGRFLGRRGEGFHHLAIDVDRLDLLAEHLAADGVPLIAKTEIPGGRKTAFVHRRDAYGVLIQFWEAPEFGGPRRR